MDSPTTYLEAVFTLVARDKALPKYQFERRIDAMLAPFMEELLSTWLDGPVVAVAPEFPLKRPHNFQSTNVDHVYLSRKNSEPRPWIFFELKTDKRSVSEPQLLTYRAAMDSGMTALRTDLGKIALRSRSRLKYELLIERFTHHVGLGDGIQLVVLSPAPIPAVKEHFPADGQVRLFKDLLSVEVERYPDEWTLFKKHVIEGVLAG